MHNADSCHSGLLIEMWKVTKVMEIKIDRDHLIAGIFPKISFIDRPSYQSTKKYDMVCRLCISDVYVHVHGVQLTVHECFIIPIIFTIVTCMCYAYTYKHEYVM